MLSANNYFSTDWRKYWQVDTENRILKHESGLLLKCFRAGELAKPPQIPSLVFQIINPHSEILGLPELKQLNSQAVLITNEIPFSRPENFDWSMGFFTTHLDLTTVIIPAVYNNMAGVGVSLYQMAIALQKAKDSPVSINLEKVAAIRMGLQQHSNLLDFYKTQMDLWLQDRSWHRRPVDDLFIRTYFSTFENTKNQLRQLHKKHEEILLYFHKSNKTIH